jgi:hypothetical protein
LLGGGWLAGLLDPYATQTQAKSQAHPKEAPEGQGRGKEGASCGQSWVEGGQAGLAEGKAGGEAGLEDQQVGEQSFEIIV